MDPFELKWYNFDGFQFFLWSGPIQFDLGEIWAWVCVCCCCLRNAISMLYLNSISHCLQWWLRLYLYLKGLFSSTQTISHRGEAETIHRCVCVCCTSVCQEWAIFQQWCDCNVITAGCLHDYISAQKWNANRMGWLVWFGSLADWESFNAWPLHLYYLKIGRSEGLTTNHWV